MYHSSAGLLIPNLSEMTMKYRGSCHCGNVAYEVEGTIEGAMACNCSMCQRKGVLMWFVPRAQLTLLTPESNVRNYTFNKHAINHRFCGNCGIHAYGDGKDPRGNEMAMINLRCIDELELDAIPVKHFNGRDL